MGKCYVTSVTQSQSHDMMSHDRHGKVVHRLCRSYISSIENLTETLLSSLCQLLMSQTSFGHISINSLTILMVLKATESPQKDLLIDTSHVLRQSIIAEILSRSTSNHYVTIY